MEKFVVKDETGLDGLNHVLHDAVLDLDTLSFDADAQTLSVDINMENYEQKTVSWHWLLLTKYSVPVMKAVLQVCSVDDYTVKDNAQIGGGGINEIIVTGKSHLHIKGVVPYDIELQISSLNICLVPTSQIVKQNVKYELNRR